MRKVFLFTLLSAASFSLAAQQQDPRGNAQEPQQDKATQERIRVEGAAGGTKPVPEDKRKAVGAGAGPHKRDTRPSPQKLPRDEPVEPGK